MKKVLGIEFGSTRIKSVLIDEDAKIIASGAHEWENILKDGFWSYEIDSVIHGMQESYADMAKNYREKFGEDLTELSAIGISAMMHGYLAFDKNDELLVPFRTWRNTSCEAEADELTDLFEFHLPQRWSTAHFYHAVKSGEKHVSDVAHLNTLSGYVHYLLTGKRVLGIGDASGMFPLDGFEYDKKMISKFNTLLGMHEINVDYSDLLPEILVAGDSAGTLTAEGALLLDPTGKLHPGCIMCPPEGDAGTGMVATNSVGKRKANVSAGTSAFLMAVLERKLASYYKEIDVVATPTGAPVAMVHSNNFASEITAWANLFEEVVMLFGEGIDRGALFDGIYKKSLEADPDVGGIMGYNFLAGEPIAKVKVGCPLIARSPNGRFTLANFMKMHIYSALGTLALGVDILKRENVAIDSVMGHGGFFKTDFVGQSAMSAALGAPVTVMKTAAEGGAFGIAVLALYMLVGEGTLDDFLERLTGRVEKTTVMASVEEKNSFSSFMEKYKRGLSAERLAGEVF